MTTHDHEAELFELVHEHASPDPSGIVWEFGLRKDPRALLRALRLLRHLPRETYTPGRGVEADMVRTALTRRVAGRSTPVHETAHALAMPETPGTYNVGRARATQRRKARAATKLGVTWRLVSDPAERQALQAAATAWEQVNPRPLYRNDRPDTEDLQSVDLWIAAYVGDRPVMLSVTPVDGEWSLLRYFRTLEDTEAASNARYLLTEAVADTLAARGVRYLCDAVSPFRLPRGLLHFSRMVGFRLIRVRVRG